MPKATFHQRIEALAALRDPVRRRLYQYVAERTAAVGRDEVAAEFGMSRAMAAFHLDKLEQAGLLRARFRRLSGRTGRGAGRPSKLYRRSHREFAVTIPERKHELLARWLSEAASETGDSFSGASRLGCSGGHTTGAGRGSTVIASISLYSWQSPSANARNSAVSGVFSGVFASRFSAACHLASSTSDAKIAVPSRRRREHVIQDRKFHWERDGYPAGAVVA